MRQDLDTIQSWIKPQSSLLDLGCGDGTLLSYLKKTKQVHGYGLEINPEQIIECLHKQINVIEQDVDKGLGNFQTGSFDVVVMSQALQAVHYPERILDDMLRVGKECIISFPNFGHWRCRMHLAIHGRMPISKMLPYTWYNTPNIHLCTFHDFENLCRRKSLRILHRTVVDLEYKDSLSMRVMPNLFGEIAIYHITRKQQHS
jgi:methionine biosynthesis protein MetW